MKNSKQARCDECGQEVRFRYVVIRDGLRLRLGEECMRRDDVIDLGRGASTTWQYIGKQGA